MREFAALYTPKNCLKWAVNSRRRCLLGTAPTVGQLSTIYGTDTVVAWMSSHLIAVNAMFNIPADRQLNMTQCMLVASSWINTYPTLKASELWVFLGDWLGGSWGKKSYGTIDPTEMGANLGEFIRNRQKVESDKVQMAFSILEQMHKKEQAGELTREQAQKQAADLVRDLRYDNGKGYFWIDTKEGVNVVLLGRPSEGKSRIDLVDPNGTYFIKEMLANGLKEGGGFTDLMFAKPNETTPLPKRNYTVCFQPWGWVIGTGVWIDQIDAQVAEEQAT